MMWERHIVGKGKEKKGDKMGKKFTVEIGTNGHIKYKGKIIAVLAQWNRFEDLDKDTLYNQIKKRNEKLHKV